MQLLTKHVKRFRTRWFNWEYWPSFVIYLPVMPYLIYLMARYRSVFFFSAANPGIEYGGFTMESKWRIQEKVNHSHFPQTMLIEKQTSFEQLLESTRSFQFPLIVKPDIGGKGRGVLVIQNEEELIWYHNNCPLDYLIQERIHYANEAGIFYVRFPGSPFGSITGIVFKTPVRITGNGLNTIVELLQQEERYALHLEQITARIQPKLLCHVLEKGKEITLMDIGNHAQGSAFTDLSSHITARLTARIDAIATQLPGFYFGRIDIRFSSWEELEEGQSFSIIEINGSGSEPTHIYDPKHSLFFAWKEILRHWKLLAQISYINRTQHIAPMRFSAGLSLLLQHRKTMKRLDKFNASLQLVSK